MAGLIHTNIYACTHLYTLLPLFLTMPKFQRDNYDKALIILKQNKRTYRACS